MITLTAKRVAAAVFVACLASAGGSPDAYAQTPTNRLEAVCTNTSGSLFRIDNFGDREYEFTLQEEGGAGAMVSGSAYPIGEGGAYAYLPAGSTAELVVDGGVAETMAASSMACPSASIDAGRPVCEGLRLDPQSRQALFVGASDGRGVTSIDITVNNGKVMVYDPQALFIVDAGGAPAAVFEVENGTETFDAGALFSAGYGLLLKGNASGAVSFFATIRSPGGVVECDPQFVTAVEPPVSSDGELALKQNAPNPYRGSTEISFTMDAPGPVSLKVYDMLGRKVATLVDGEQAAGPHTVIWDGTSDTNVRVSSGTYLYRLQAGDKTLTRTMTMVQ